MAVKPVVYDDSTKKHRPLGSGEKMDGLSASSVISADSGNLIGTGSDGLAYATGSGIIDPAADNLLEATSGGKIKMDIDRIIEWLDGHSQDAKEIADAINVVSGDSGNLVVEGSDSGAYLSKSAIAGAVADMTDAQKNALADAIAARIAADIADGQTIVASGGKITVNLTNATVAQKKAIANALAGSGIGVNSSSGRFDVDFSAMDAETLSRLVSNIIQENGGLAQDEDGKIYVDFETMDDTKFRKMMQGFIDKQTIKRAGGGNYFYVDGSAGNADGDREPTDEDPRENIGGPSDPFYTIQHCVDYITHVYKFADVDTYINCKNVSLSLSKPLTLPSFDRTTAEITIRGASFNASTPRNSPTAVTGNTITLSYSPEAYVSPRYTVNVIGSGVWRLRNFDASITDASLTGDGGHLAALHVMDYATCYINDCKFTNNRSTADSAGLAKYDYTTGEHVIFLSNYGALELGASNVVVCNDVTNATASATRKVVGISVADSATLHIGDTRSDKAYTVLEFTRASGVTGDITVPAGTQVKTSADDSPVFATRYDLVIPAAADRGSVYADCTTAGGNGVAAGALTTLVDTSITNVTVTNTSKSNYATTDDSDRRLVMTGSFSRLMYVTSRVSRNAAFQGQVDVSRVANADYRFYIYAGGNVRVSDLGLLDADHNNARAADTWLGTSSSNADGTPRVSYVQTSTYSWYD